MKFNVVLMGLTEIPPFRQPYQNLKDGLITSTRFILKPENEIRRHVLKDTNDVLESREKENLDVSPNNPYFNIHVVVYYIDNNVTIMSKVNSLSLPY